MADNLKVLSFKWRNMVVDVRVDVDKCTLLDIVVDYEDEAKKHGMKLDYGFPTFSYVYKQKHWYLIEDKDLITMFERLPGKDKIDIRVGTVIKLNALYKWVLNLRRKNEATKGVDENVIAGNDDLPRLDELEDTSIGHVNPEPKQKPKTKPQPKPKLKPKKRGQTSNVNLPPLPISPKSAFEALPVRRSPRFSPTLNASVAPTSPVTKNSSVSGSDEGLFNKKVPKTTARRKGLVLRTTKVASTTESVVHIGESATEGRNVRRMVDFDGDGDCNDEQNNVGENEDENVPSDENEEEHILPNGNVPADEIEDITTIPKFKDSWKSGQWHDFIDEDDDTNYYNLLYKNGEMYEDKGFGKIVLRPWMIFMDKMHFKDTLKDYVIQEGFGITVLCADSTRYTATCYAENCGWRIHASRLPDDKTWAIKKIEPNTHSCRGLETYNPLCDVIWASSKLMEDIRANPEIPGKALDELLFQRYGVYMKRSTLYTMKKYTIEKLFGGHDESYRDLPAYTRVICDTNPDSKAYCSSLETESIPKQLLFNTVFISLSAMWKGFRSGCRPLIGIHPNVCNDSNTSNFVESFNATLEVDRTRPVLSLLEGIRRVCMVRISTRLQIAMNWDDDGLCPKIVKALKEISKGTISCKAYMSKPGEYEIHEGKSQFPLSLNNKLCSCGAWQLSKIPCRHAVRAMIHAKIDPQKVVSSWYLVRTYKQTYTFNINPIPDKENWPAYEGLPSIMPPQMKKGVGRPSRNRKREEGEEQKGKRSKTVKCTNCGHFGHNARTCKGAPTAKELKAADRLLVRNPRVRNQSNAAKEAKKATKAAKDADKGNASQPSNVTTQSQQQQP